MIIIVSLCIFGEPYQIVNVMKLIPFIGLCMFVTACNQGAENGQKLQTQIDSLQASLKNTYRPGFGEFMSDIQVHHEKLWFAGQNQNWKLADFEINEIKESLDDINKYCTDRPERKSLGMIDEPLQNIETAIQQKKVALFKSDFIILTSTCNSCHQATSHGFNVIKIPTTPPFSNQDFSAGTK